MAKLTPVILPGDKPNEYGLFNVKIRIGHKSKNAYIETDEFVGKKHLTPDKEIKVSFIVDHCSDILKQYNDILKSNKTILPVMDHLQVKELLINTVSNGAKEGGGNIMFLEFCDTYINGLKPGNTAMGLRTIYYRLRDYLGGGDVPATEITSIFLKSFEDYLRSPCVVRRNNSGVMRNMRLKAANNTTISSYMGRVRSLHNSAKEKFNDEETGVFLIPNNPFKKYVIVQPNQRANHRDYSIDQVAKIRDCVLPKGSRAELAREIWMLSFYEGGMNSVDIYNLPTGDVQRVNYNRQKTRGKRKDDAYISIRLFDEAKLFYDKYAGHLPKRFTHIKSFNSALYEGMKKVRIILGDGFEDLDPYSARHSVATIAANDCGYSDEDVAKLLNHEDGKYRVTKGYIRKSWAKIDEMQAAVIALLPPTQ